MRSTEDLKESEHSELNLIQRHKKIIEKRKAQFLESDGLQNSQKLKSKHTNVRNSKLYQKLNSSIKEQRRKLTNAIATQKLDVLKSNYWMTVKNIFPLWYEELLAYEKLHSQPTFSPNEAFSPIKHLMQRKDSQLQEQTSQSKSRHIKFYNADQGLNAATISNAIQQTVESNLNTSGRQHLIADTNQQMDNHHIPATENKQPKSLLQQTIEDKDINSFLTSAPHNSMNHNQHYNWPQNNQKTLKDDPVNTFLQSTKHSVSVNSFAYDSKKKAERFNL